MDTHLIAWAFIATLIPALIGAATLGNAIHARRAARGACTCEEHAGE